jgi:hypothetical protein
MAFTWLPQQETLAKASDAALIASLASSRNWIVSGLALGVPGSGLQPTITTGTAWIDGYVATLASETIAVTNNTTTTVYLGLTVDGFDNVTGVALSLTVPSSGYYVTLGTVTASGGNITSTDTTGRSPITQGGATWGEIGGTLSNQTDLQTALNGKVSTTGNESIDGIKTFTSVPVVPNDSFAFAKLQNIATARILGRSTALSGDIEELTAAQVLTLLGIGELPIVNSSSSNQTISSTTMADVTGLSLTGLSANSTYIIKVVFGGRRVSGTQNLNVRSIVTGRSGTIYCSYFTLSGAVQYSDSLSYATDTGTTINGVFTGTDPEPYFVQLVFRFVTGGSGGTFKIQAAMNGGSASARIDAGASIITAKQ